MKSFVSQIILMLLVFITCKADFYSPFELPRDKRPQGLFNAMQASFRIYNSKALGDFCSASLISNSGYVVTALHCLENCLLQQNRLKHKEFPAELGKLFWLPEPATPENPIHCPDIQTESSPGLSDAQIVYSGAGYAEFIDSRIGEFSDDEFHELIDKMSDFAILKFATSRKLTCLQADWSELQFGDSVWSLASPGLTSRRNHNSNGNDQFASIGKIESDILNNPIIRALPATPEIRSRYSRWANQKVFLSDLDFYSGSSGAPIINSKGKLIGVTSSVIGPGRSLAAKQFTPFSSLSTPLAIFRTQFPKDSREEFFKLAFDCQL